MPMGATLRSGRANPMFTHLNLRCKPDVKKKPALTSLKRASGGTKSGQAHAQEGENPHLIAEFGGISNRGH